MTLQHRLKTELLTPCKTELLPCFSVEILISGHYFKIKIFSDSLYRFYVEISVVMFLNQNYDKSSNINLKYCGIDAQYIIQMVAVYIFKDIVERRGRDRHRQIYTTLQL